MTELGAELLVSARGFVHTLGATTRFLLHLLALTPTGLVRFRLIVEQVYDHQSNVGQGTDLVLVIDGWEHAYYLDYLNDKAAWTDAFWEVADWKSAGTRFDTLLASTPK